MLAMEFGTKNLFLSVLKPKTCTWKKFTNYIQSMSLHMLLALKIREKEIFALFVNNICLSFSYDFDQK